MRHLLKLVLRGLFLVLAFVPALLCGFGRLKAVYSIWANAFALLPGLLGDYSRTCFYFLTLDAFPLDSRVQFGSFFVHPQARVGHNVYIGIYCVLGRTEIGDRAHIASGVQILSGSKQHSRDADGRIQGSERGIFETVRIGSDGWIGAGAIVMAAVGDRSTIGAGAIVTKPIPADVIAVGNPAKVIRSSAPTAEVH